VCACLYLSPDFVWLMFSSVVSTSLVLVSCTVSSKVLKFTPNALFSILHTYLGRWDSSAPE
jgi:hypothetical protein